MTPEGWHLAPLGELAVLVNGDRGKNYPSRLEFVENGIPFINAGHIRNGRIDLTEMHYITHDRFDLLGGGKVRENDLLYCLRGSLGKVAPVGNVVPGAIASSLVILRPRNSAWPEYLLCLLTGPIGETIARELDSGSAQPNISARNLQRYCVPVPPLAEQKKIAAILSSVDDAILATQAVIEQLQVVKKAMMAELLTRGLPGRHTKFKMTEIGEVPEEWEVASLGQVCGVTSGGTPSRDRPEFWSGSIPWVKTGEINYVEITSTGETISAIGVANSSAKVVPKGALLMAMYGQGATRGRVAMLGIDAALNQACLAILPGGRIANRFLFHVLCDKYEELRSLGHEGTQKNLNATLVKEIFIPVPSHDEQERITELLDAIDTRVVTEVEERQARQNVKSALMSVLLTGEVRVKLDPTDAAAQPSVHPTSSTPGSSLGTLG